MVTEDKSLFTLSNAGTKRNCSLTAVLAPINLKLIQFEIGKPFSNTGLTSMVSYFVTRYIVIFFKGLKKDEVISANYNDNIFPVKCTALHEIGTRSASKKLVKTQNILDDSIFVMLII